MMKMSNSDRYIASFDHLSLSGDFQDRIIRSLENEREDKKVNNIRTFRIGRVAAIAAVFSLVCGSVCYAADLGGIRTTIRLWIEGKSRSVEVTEVGDGVFSWTDENGDNRGFGGVSSTDGGEIKAMPAEEMAAYMNNSAELEFAGDKIIFHYHNLGEDVTEKVLPDGKLYVHVEDPANPNTYFDFSGIGNGEYSLDCSAKPEKDAVYVEADTTSLVSGDPVEKYDEDTELSFTTQVTK